MRFSGARMPIALAAVFAAVLGCSSRGRMDLLESRLRHQEDSINELQAKLTKREGELQTARHESLTLKTQLAETPNRPPIEQISSLGQVEAITLNKFLSGGLDRDGVPGDEALSAVIVPTDGQGNLVKVPGALDVTVLDLSQPDDQQRVGRWEFNPQQSEALWHSGFLGSGYVVRVPWQVAPRSANLLLHARLKTVDGRQFDASQSIRIKPPPASTPANHVEARTPADDADAKRE